MEKKRKHFGVVFLCWIACFCSHNAIGQEYDSKQIIEYINQYAQAAIEQMNMHKIPASITLAQGILESGAGTSALARQANNHFGIKCHNTWKGAAMYKNDDKANECFRKYSHPLESFDDHSRVLQAKRYSELFLLELTDYKGWARGLKKCGYATNPQYADKLISIIEKYELQAFDKVYSPLNPYQDLPLAENTTVQKSGLQATHTPSQSIDIENKHAKSVYPKPIADKPVFKPRPVAEDDPIVKETKPVYKGFHAIDYPYTDRPVYRNNDACFVVAQKGDTYYSIAVDVQLGINTLKSYNDLLDKKYEPMEGEPVYIEKKSKYAGQRVYVTRGGETLRDISQMYGCQLSTLLKLNDIPQTTSLPHDTKIIMRK
ncbi:MAG: glucosaminidase domain-containing protein [Bacteroidales bacterium]|jgi:LysM repeat protein|nr:glucosaminidase domain-containing protein [Bacteroidales bacterium]